MSLKVVSRPKCPKCKGKEVERYGYLKSRGGSEYGCRNPECEHIFVVPTLRLNITERTA